MHIGSYLMELYGKFFYHKKAWEGSQAAAEVGAQKKFLMKYKIENLMNRQRKPRDWTEDYFCYPEFNSREHQSE